MQLIKRVIVDVKLYLSVVHLFEVAPGSYILEVVDKFDRGTLLRCQPLRALEVLRLCSKTKRNLFVSL